MFLTHEDETIEYTIKHSNRKSVEIKIMPTGIVALKGPKMPEGRYEDILIKRWMWIQTQRLKIQQMTGGLVKRHYSTGESFMILGKRYPVSLRTHEHQRAEVKLLADELLFYVPKDFTLEQFQALMVAFLKRLLKQHMVKRVQYYAHQFHSKVNKISIRDQKTRWGSCSSNRNINFNYRLALAPLEIIDYIVVHEMSHLEHMNHSKSFWKKVHQVMPDYQMAEQWLKMNGFKLSVIYREE